MGSTSNLELENIADYYGLDELVSVCQKDQLSSCPIVNNGFYIINNESSTSGSGSHWTCLYFNKNISFFCDSFGAPPSQEIIKFCKGKTKHLKHSNFITQHLHSENCGYFCIGFILFMCHNNFKYLEYIKAFDENTKRNDLILEGLFRIYLNNKQIPPELNRFFNMTYRK